VRGQCSKPAGRARREAQIAPERPIPNPAILDLDDLRARAGGDAALVGDLLAIFEAEILPEARRLAAGEVVPEDRSAAAHRLRGAALAIGGGEVAALAATIEADPGGEAGLLALGAALQRLSAAIAGR
jgi:HPt (histidine-containing phosphotransfer) domain-containing protein